MVTLIKLGFNNPEVRATTELINCCWRVSPFADVKPVLPMRAVELVALSITVCVNIIIANSIIPIISKMNTGAINANSNAVAPSSHAIRRRVFLLGDCANFTRMIDVIQPDTNGFSPDYQD